MTEYYTTSELWTKEIAVLQGFQGYFYSIGMCNDYPCSKWHFPKTQHNVALMKVRENDLVKIIGGVDRQVAYCYKIESELYLSFCGSSYANNMLCRSIITIIQRNNMPFPVWDKPTS
jgi:hypothetical protein